MRDITDPTRRSLEAALLTTLSAHPEIAEVNVDPYALYAMTDTGDVYRVSVTKVPTTHPGPAIH